ncbi:hypothetical protein T12_7710 [Trichinella patagoniensis]|uniref:Uncharacterized protein n=1 Tax=Trichinella patagoniensis TaxID=990121 RepID=A0A0V0ZGD3_9BILA|nr:hypothetical protein T12_7710 [Trichinella patagoniensis]
MPDSKEAVIKAGDAAVVSEGGYLPPCCVGGLSRSFWIVWRMKHYEIVATYFDLFKVIVNITAPLEKPTKPLQYFFENSVMPMWEDYENIGSCRCQVVMKKKHGKAAQILFINLCKMAISSQKCLVMEHVNGIVFGYSLKGFEVAVLGEKWMNLDDLNVLKDKLMQMTKGNCRFYCKLNPTFLKKTEALEE